MKAKKTHDPKSNKENKSNKAQKSEKSNKSYEPNDKKLQGQQSSPTNGQQSSPTKGQNPSSPNGKNPNAQTPNNQNPSPSKAQNPSPSKAQNPSPTPEQIEKQHRHGKLHAVERIEQLVDPESFLEIGSSIEHHCSQFGMAEKRLPYDGVITGFATINGRQVALYSQDFTVMGGTLGEMHGRKIARIIRLAIDSKCPLIGINDSGGARIQEGINALGGYGDIFKLNTEASGYIPQISIIVGPCAGGAVYSPGITDFVFVVDRVSHMFVTGPKVVKKVLFEEIDTEALGGARMHAGTSGVAHFFADSEVTCFAQVQRLLSFLPQFWDDADRPQFGSFAGKSQFGSDAGRPQFGSDADRPQFAYSTKQAKNSPMNSTMIPSTKSSSKRARSEKLTNWARSAKSTASASSTTSSSSSISSISSIVPENPRTAYDVRNVIAALADADSFFEVSAAFAKNMVIGFGRLLGMPVGFVANQPRHLAGVIDCDASDKAARFIRFCDAFQIPLLTLVDVPGFMPGALQERLGIIRHGAKLLYAYSEATVPSITLITRKAYGGAYIAMCSKHLGADFVYAWPLAEIAVMGAEGAVEVLFRKELRAASSSSGSASSGGESFSSGDADSAGGTYSAGDKSVSGTSGASWSADSENPNPATAEMLKKQRENEYAEAFLNPTTAAKYGIIDEIIHPEDSREIIIRSFQQLLNKSPAKPFKKHGNIPL